MSGCQTIMLTSFKGGVGKSTLTANLALALAQRGKKTLALDCDFNMRCLDIIMGRQDDVVYDICDYICRDVPASRVIIPDSRSENLFFCAAPYHYTDVIRPERFAEALKQIASDLSFDYILADTPGDSGSPLRLTAAVSDMALVVATHQPASIRAAEKTAISLTEMKVPDTRLIINCFDASAVRKGTLPGIIDIIDRTRVQLIGVIPLDRRMNEYQECGELLLSGSKRSDTAQAFQNIAERIDNRYRNLPLFSHFKHSMKDVICRQNTRQEQ